MNEELSLVIGDKAVVLVEPSPMAGCQSGKSSVSRGARPVAATRYGRNRSRAIRLPAVCRS